MTSNQISTKSKVATPANMLLPGWNGPIPGYERKNFKPHFEINGTKRLKTEVTKQPKTEENKNST